MNVKRRTRIAAIIIKDKKLLMLKGKAHKELWTPGGKTETGENDEQCLRRELKEELGVEIVKMEFFKEYSGESFYHKNEMMRQRVYTATIKGKLTPAMEIESVVWLTKDDFKNRKHLMITITEEEIIPDLIEAGYF